MMSETNRKLLASVITASRQVTRADRRHCCWACDHDVEVCDCGLSKLRGAVDAWDASELPGEETDVKR